MNTPGFTAEASLNRTRESYRPTAGTATESGKVLPQGYYVRQTGDGFDIVICEPGYGCTVFHHKNITLF